MTVLYNIKFKNSIIHKNLNVEDAADKLQDYADMFYGQKDDRFNPSFLEMEEIIDAG